jgi:hypothetical protein
MNLNRNHFEIGYEDWDNPICKKSTQELHNLAFEVTQSCKKMDQRILDPLRWLEERASWPLTPHNFRISMGHKKPFKPRTRKSHGFKNIESELDMRVGPKFNFLEWDTLVPWPIWHIIILFSEMLNFLIISFNKKILWRK